MTYLPVVERELRVASRRPGTYWGRGAAAFLAIALGTYVYAAATRGFSGPQLGRILFLSLAWLAFLSCVLAGVRHTASCISVERREGTLGLLFLTDLKGYDITLGKLVASSVSALQGLLAIVPVIAVPLLMGGITATQVSQVVAALLATLLYSLAVGIFVSTWFDKERRAMAVTALILLVATVGPWLAVAIWSTANQAPPPPSMLLASPAYVLALATTGGLPGVSTAGHYELGLVLLAGQGVLGLALASLVVPRLCRDRAVAARPRGWRGLWRQWRDGPASVRNLFRTRLLNVNPFFWLAARDRRGPLYVWAVLTLSVGGWFTWLGLWPTLRQEMDAGRFIIPSIFVHGVLRAWIAFAATQQLGEDRRSGALELLLSTPLSPREVIAGQLRAIRRQFGGPVVAALALDVWLCGATSGELSADQDLAMQLYLARGFMLLADGWAIAWYGMWSAVTTRSSSEATAATLGRVFVIPWGVLITAVLLFHTFELEQRWGWTISDQGALASWFLLGVMTDAVLYAFARGRLLTRFRTVATQLRTAPGWWTRIFEGSASGL